MSAFNEADHAFMQRALELASKAQELGEVPVGAVLVEDNEIIAEGYNSPIASNDATAHAEVSAIRAGCEIKQNYRLPNTTLYATLEPCAMCAGAIVHARVARVVIAALEPRAGAAGSTVNILQHPALNHHCQLDIGLLASESSAMLKAFFKSRR